MGQDSGISWTDHTFNPWWGCVKVSPACTNCYAATLDKRVGGDNWGIDSPRRFFGDKHWNEPRKWDKEAASAGVRRRVFCASMADVFEDRDDLVPHRRRLWQLIEDTPNLDWLLLTKRPENIKRMLPDAYAMLRPESQPFFLNVWLGTTVENQTYANARIPHLVDNPAVVHFLSCEPLLGPIDLRLWLDGRVNWIIAGAESGPKSRITDVEWYRSLRDQARGPYTSSRHRAAFFLKQATLYSDVVRSGDGSHFKGGPRSALVELPYLDGVQHAEFPSSKFRNNDGGSK